MNNFECPRCGHCCQAEVNKEAMQMALEALESDPMSHAGLVSRKQAITALRQVLVDADDTSQKRVDEMVKTEHDRAVELGKAYERGWNAALAQQEPVAWIKKDRSAIEVSIMSAEYMTNEGFEPLYTAPPKKQWVGLTDEEIQDLSYLAQKIDEGNSAWFDRWGFARAIEAKLREKNT